MKQKISYVVCALVALLSLSACQPEKQDASDLNNKIDSLNDEISSLKKSLEDLNNSTAEKKTDDHELEQKADEGGHANSIIPVLMCFKDGDICAYFREDGTVAIPPKKGVHYINDFFSNGLAFASVDLQQGFINLKGEWEVPPSFDVGTTFENEYDTADWDDKGNLIKTNSANQSGYLDRFGNWVVPLTPNLDDRFVDIHQFQNGLAVASAEIDNAFLYGYINRDLQWVIQPQFQYANRFSVHNLAAVKQNGKLGYIDKKGAWRIPAKYDAAYNFYNEKVTFVGVKNVSGKMKYALIRDDGQLLTQFIFSRVDSFNYARAIVYDLNERCGVINEKGKWDIKPEFDEILPFSKEGHALASQNGRWGVINLKGEWIRAPEIVSVLSVDYPSYYSGIFNFEKKGIDIVSDGNLKALIDSQGNLLTPYQFSNVEQIDNVNFIIVEKADKWGAINRKGEWVIQPQFQMLGAFMPNTPILAKYNNLYGYVDEQGNWLIKPQFQLASSFKNGILAKATLNNQEVVINPKGEIVARLDSICQKEVIKNAKGDLLWPLVAPNCADSQEKLTNDSSQVVVDEEF